MQYRQLGSSMLQVSVIGFGCWQAGGYYWGQVDESQWIAAVQHALDGGVTLFDTADFYGFGRSEEWLAKALGKRREEVIIATKVGLVSRNGRSDFGSSQLLELEEHIGKDLSRRHIIEAVEASLRRLRTDVIDLYLLHWPDPITPIEETMAALEELYTVGKIRAAGCCNFPVDLMKEAAARFPLAAHELPYSVLHREAEKALLPACREASLGVIAYWVLCKGLLSGKYGEQSTFGEDDWRHYDPLFRGEAYRRNLRVVSKLREVAAAASVTIGQLAIGWTLQQPGITSAIIGAKTPEQASENARAGAISLSLDTLSAITAAITEEDSA